MHSVVATLQEPEESCLKSPDPFCLNGIVWNTTVLLSCYSLPIYMCQAVLSRNKKYAATNKFQLYYNVQSTQQRASTEGRTCVLCVDTQVIDVLMQCVQALPFMEVLCYKCLNEIETGNRMHYEHNTHGHIPCAKPSSSFRDDSTNLKKKKKKKNC